MRCLQCGKEIPLLKRLAGSEFCSDAHRREYKEEYSQLALGRLLQSKPSETDEKTGIKFGTAVSAFIEEPPPVRPLSKVAVPVVSITPATETPTHAIASAAASPARNADQLAPLKKAASDPAIGAPMRVQKPAPAALHTLAAAAAEFDQDSASRTPDPPSGRAPMQPIERKLELRPSLRATQAMNLDIGIVAPHSLEAANDSLDIPKPSAVAPPEAQPWMEEARGEFTGSVIALLDFGRFEFSTLGLEELPQIGGDPGTNPTVKAPLAESVAYPVPQLDRLPVSVAEVAAGKSKAIQVFGSASFSAGCVQVPQPSGLPLRPVMVLVQAPVESPAASLTRAKASEPPAPVIAPPAPVIAPPPEARTPVRASVEPEFAPPGSPLPSAGISRAAKILTAIAATAVLAIGSFLVFGNRSDAGPNLTISTPAASDHVNDQWIANFAPLPKQQRKVSVVRSSMSLSDYRLEFESSIQIKGLGWVYRAQDSKNFYVGKIELEKAGLNPQYVIAHYAVIGGEDQARAQTPLQTRVPLGGHYQIRLEALGSRFTTWINDQKMDEWTDDRLTAGGAGLYREGVEQSTLYGNFRITPLSKKK